MSELLAAVVSWRTLVLVVLVFGFAPGFCLRLLVKLYPKDDPRRRELVADLYALGHFERLLYVGEQLETVLFEGVPCRVRVVLAGLKTKNGREKKLLFYEVLSALLAFPGVIYLVFSQNNWWTTPLMIAGSGIITAVTSMLRSKLEKRRTSKRIRK